MRFSFSRENRIAKKETFQAIYKHSFCFKARYVYLYFLPSKQKYSRLGLTVSRKVGNAVVRSRMKRYYREFFRLDSDRFNTPYFDLVVNVKSIASSKERNVLYEDFMKNIKTIRKICEN